MMGIKPNLKGIHHPVRLFEGELAFAEFALQIIINLLNHGVALRKLLPP